MNTDSKNNSELEKNSTQTQAEELQQKVLSKAEQEQRDKAGSNFENHKWDDISPNRTVWKHKELPLIIKLEYEKPLSVKDAGSVQIVKKSNEVDDKGNDVDVWIYKRDDGRNPKFRGVIRDAERKMQKRLFEEKQQKDLADFKELGFDKWVEKQAQENITSELLREAYIQLAKDKRGKSKKNGYRRQDEWEQKEDLNEILYTKQSSWKREQDDVFIKEYGRIFEGDSRYEDHWGSYQNYGFLEYANKLEDDVEEEQRDKIIKQWKKDRAEHFIPLLKQHLEGADSWEEIIRQGIKELKELLSTCSEEGLEYYSKSFILECKNDVEEMIKIERKKWTPEQWRQLNLLRKDRQDSLKQLDKSKIEDYGRNTIQAKNIDEAVKKGEDFWYKCRYCKDAGEEVVFKKVFETRQFLIYECSRCENTVYWTYKEGLNPKMH